MALKGKIIQTVTRKLTALQAGEFDPLLVADSVDEAEQYILNYCNIRSVPAALQYVWANLAVDYLRWADATGKENQTGEQTGETGNGTYISGLKEGDVSLSFSQKTDTQTAKNSAAHSMDAALDNYLFRYEDALNKFRRVVW